VITVTMIVIMMAFGADRWRLLLGCTASVQQIGRSLMLMLKLSTTFAVTFNAYDCDGDGVLDRVRSGR
jgi:hypothetical protein